MTKTHKKKTKKVASTRRKAPNKRKPMMTARAEKQVATRRVPMAIAEEAPRRLPFAFWPLEVMKWWMPRATRS